MAEERVQRRLAAILAADVAGYSRLMGEDEEGTLAALTAHRTELIEPCIAEPRGRVVKTTGNGLLAEFASVVDAVRCAVGGLLPSGMVEHGAIRAVAGGPWARARFRGRAHAAPAAKAAGVPRPRHHTRACGRRKPARRPAPALWFRRVG